MNSLGMNLYLLCLKVQGTLPPNQMEAVLGEIVTLAGMRTGGLKAQAWTYPLDENGTGGAGSTIIQPLVESFLVSDDWIDHGHTFIILASCRKYSARAITAYIRKVLGPILKIRRVSL